MSHTKAWQEFITAARSDGSLIEALIRDFYANELLGPGDQAVDGGAHSGLHTLPLADVLTMGSVVAVDANEILVGRLKQKLGPGPNVCTWNSRPFSPIRRRRACSSTSPPATRGEVESRGFGTVSPPAP